VCVLGRQFCVTVNALTVMTKLLKYLLHVGYRATLYSLYETIAFYSCPLRYIRLFFVASMQFVVISVLWFTLVVS